MLFVDKHRPKSLSDLSYHEELSERLRGLADSEDLPHLLFYGPSGAGKKTRIHALIKELFGPGAHKVGVTVLAHGSLARSTDIRSPPTQLKIDQRVFLNPSKRKIDVNIISSTYHQEITPSCVESDTGFRYRLVIKWLLTDNLCSCSTLLAETQQDTTGWSSKMY